MFSHTVKIALYSHAQKSIKLRNPFDFKGFQPIPISPLTVKLRSRRDRYVGTYQLLQKLLIHNHI